MTLHIAAQQDRAQKPSQAPVAQPQTWHEAVRQSLGKQDLSTPVSAEQTSPGQDLSPPPVRTARMTWADEEHDDEDMEDNENDTFDEELEWYSRRDVDVGDDNFIEEQVSQRQNKRKKPNLPARWNKSKKFQSSTS